MKKKILALMVSLALLLVSGVPAFAAGPGEKQKDGADSGVHILLDNTDYAEAFLNFSGDRADCSAIIHAKDGTTKITATALLKRVESNGTTTVKAWTGLSAEGDTLYFDRQYYVAGGYTYEFEIDAQVYRNGTVEYISVSDDDYCG